MSSTDTPQRGYSEIKGPLRNRLRRIGGQVRGVEKMIDEDRYCIDVITQISAIQAALDKVALELLTDHARHCVVRGRGGGDPDEQTEELMAAVARLTGRR
jgi:DNA-binding FrmR family transcriptional regulator